MRTITLSVFVLLVVGVAAIGQSSSTPGAPSIGPPQPPIPAVLADLQKMSPEIQFAGDRIHITFEEAGLENSENEYLMLLALRLSTNNATVIAQLSKYAAANGGGGQNFYVLLAQLASKAKFASTEFVRIAESLWYFGFSPDPLTLLAISLVSASSKQECRKLMDDNARYLLPE